MQDCGPRSPRFWPHYATGILLYNALSPTPKSEEMGVLHVLQRGYKAVGFGKAGLNRFCLLLATIVVNTSKQSLHCNFPELVLTEWEFCFVAGTQTLELCMILHTQGGVVL